MMIHFIYHHHHRHHHHHQLLSLLLWLLVVLAIAVGCTLGFTTTTTTTTTTKTSSACSSSISSSASASASASASSSFGGFSSSTFVTSTTQSSSSSSPSPSSSSSSSSSALQMVSSSSNEFSGKDLLYQDQQLAMERRANEEEILLNTSTKSKPKELTSPKKLKPKPPKSGKGFGSNVKTRSSGDTDNDNDDDDSIENRIAIEQCKIIQRDGVIKISNVLSEQMADELREYVLEQQTIASQIVKESNNSLSVSKSFYGVENSRKSRCDLQLSLLKGGYLSDGNNINGNESSVHQKHTIADTLNALLGSGSNNSGSSSSKTTNNGGGKNGDSKKNGNGNNRGIGTLRKVYENLVTKDGEFYELAAVITNPGSKRQQIHPDLPYQNDNGAPLYVVFLALQDITEEMGPTTFLLKTHNSQSHQTQFLSNDIEIKNNQLLKIASSNNVKISTLQKGDCVIFDARILHCGNANLDETNGGRTRALFNFSFRNPKVTGNLGYPGSIRPGYIKQMNLNDMFKCLDNYNTNNNKIGDDNDNDDPFKEYGDGLLH